jgi:hypothetical protein
MSAGGSGGYGSGTGVPVGDAVAVPVQEAAALTAWREAVQNARHMLLGASRLVECSSEGGSDARLGLVLAGLRDLETRIDGHLATPAGQAGGSGRPATQL